MVNKAKILELVEILTGTSGRRIVEFLLDIGTEVSDEEIAQKLNMRVNDVRRALYELARYGIVSYKRISRRESFWYTYRWFIDKDTLARVLLQRKKNVLRKLEERLSYEESNVFYACPFDGSRYSFDEAFENYFKCPKCGSDLIEVNNQEVVNILRKLIDKLRKEIEEDEERLSRPI